MRKLLLGTVAISLLAAPAFAMKTLTYWSLWSRDASTINLVDLISDGYEIKALSGIDKFGYEYVLVQKSKTVYKCLIDAGIHADAPTSSLGCYKLVAPFQFDIKS